MRGGGGGGGGGGEGVGAAAGAAKSVVGTRSADTRAPLSALSLASVRLAFYHRPSRH